MKSKHKKPPSPKDWQLLEQTVAFLEKQLSPDATVLHNQRLPVLGSKRRRQCDVVIRSGRPPRDTLTIVEVQRRGQKPELNTFHGWHAKMIEVGAQHLICVSRKGFPSSVVESVFCKFGPTVRLMTLAQIEKITLPGLILELQFMSRYAPKFRYENLSAKVVPNADGHPLIEIRTDERVIESGAIRDRLVSINDLVAEYLNRTKGAEPPPVLTDEPERVSFVQEGDLWIHTPNGKFELRALSASLLIDHFFEKIPLSFSEYRQEEIAGGLAWVATADAEAGEHSERHEVVFKLNEKQEISVSARSPEGRAMRLYVSPNRAALKEFFENRTHKQRGRRTSE